MWVDFLQLMLEVESVVLKVKEGGEGRLVSCQTKFCSSQDEKRLHVNQFQNWPERN